MARYLKATGREAIADAAAAASADLRADAEVAADPGRLLRPGHRDRPVDPRAADQRPPHPRPGPHGQRARRRGPGRGLADRDLVAPSSARAPTRPTRTSPGPRRSPGWRPPTASAAKTELLITPGSEQVRATIERDGLLADLEAIGATVLANACGPCIGQWARTDVDEGGPQHDRHQLQPQLPQAQRRQRQHPRLRHLARDRRRPGPRRHASTSTPLTDTLTSGRRQQVRLEPPVGEQLPARGFDPGETGFLAPPADGAGVEVEVDPDSERLQLLEPFAPWDGEDYVDLPVLMKATGKCTTDHISAAGPWLKYRGHLENISGNLFLGAVNAFTGRGRQRQGPARRRDPSRSPTSPSTSTRPGRRLVRHRRRELRRGQLA